VALEDYYHVSALNRIIEPGRWSRFERRLEIGTERTLDLLDEYNIRATFFVLGWVADTAPELVRKVASRGHEIASKGYNHRGIWQMSPGEFREDLVRAQEALERASGQGVIGYRVGRRWLSPRDLWVLDELIEAGYVYDSSIKPLLRTFSGEPWRRFAHEHRSGSGTLWEFPLSTVDILGLRVPIAGGNYFRQLPQRFIERAVARWDRDQNAPFVMYFHTWELDPHQPRVEAAPLYQRVRHYRNLGKMEGILRDYFNRYRFESVANRLGIDMAGQAPRVTPGAAVPAAAPSVMSPSAPTATRPAPTPVSVLIPCYNEEAVLPYLRTTLEQVAERLSGEYRLHYIFVNDGSSDGTASALERIFGSAPNCTVIHHERNQGVSAAILTGIRHAGTEVVCSIDCDCTYDPHQLGAMLPMLTDGVDLVTASPYHRLGKVKNVPAWRLSLSRSASAFYRLVLRHKLQTYTSCFRVYRRSTILALPLREPGFLGITELLGQIDLRGGRIIECPAELEVRVLGRSKMKVIRTIFGHLGLLSSLLAQRIASRRA
jgi:polysaccharide deacetylase family protein (PEP-CTERM system associated)